MSEGSIIKALAKVLVAAAWADGSISGAELNDLKDLLFHLPGMTASDWAEIDIYIDSPVEEAERGRLLAQLQDQLSSPDQQQQVLQAIDQLVQADGEVSPAELAVVDEIKAAVDGASVGTWGRMMHNRMRRRASATSGGPDRELDLEDFTQNKIYYTVHRRMEASGGMPALPEAQLRKLSLAGGLLARIAYVDDQVSAPETEKISQALQALWGLSAAEAALVTEVAVSEVSRGLDYYSLTRHFFEATTENERLDFLDVLFAAAASDGQASFAEMEEIRTIAIGMLLTHQQYIEAKLRLPAAQREI